MTAPLEVRVGEPAREVAVEGLAAVEARLAADAPDSLEASFRGAGGRSLPELRPGQAVELAAAGSVVFEGSVREVRRGPSPGVLTLRAEPEWVERASRLPFEEELYQVTDAEAAECLAARLGLEGDIEPSARVHTVLVRRGDPLSFLRERALAAGFTFALGPGRLHFAPRLPAARRTRLLGPGAGVVLSALLGADKGRVEKGGGEKGDRTAWVAIRGAFAARPLEGVRLVGLGERLDGLYRLGRLSLEAGRGGILTSLLLLEDDRRLAELDGAVFSPLGPPEGTRAAWNGPAASGACREPDAGWSLPLELDASGMFPAHRRDPLGDAARLVLGVAPGERPLLPGFGWKAHCLRRLDGTVALKAAAVWAEEALRRWAPHLAVECVEVEAVDGRGVEVRVTARGESRRLSIELEPGSAS